MTTPTWDVTPPLFAVAIALPAVAAIAALAAATVYALNATTPQGRKANEALGKAIVKGVEEVGETIVAVGSGMIALATAIGDAILGDCPPAADPASPADARPADAPAPEGAPAEAEPEVKLTPKIEKQMGPRGWTEEAIKDTIKNPSHVSEAENKANGNPAEASFDKDGNYVVQDKMTKEIIQVSNKNDPKWIPDPTIKNPPPKP